MAETEPTDNTNDENNDSSANRLESNSDVVIVDSKTDHDKAINDQMQQEQNVEQDQEDEKDDSKIDESNTNGSKEETEVRETTITSLITIKFDEDNYIGLKYKTDEFALYKILISIGSETDINNVTTFYLYLRYSDIDKFHRKLTYFHNRLCKFKTDLKQTLVLPKLPPKKQWQRNKLDKNFLCERIRLLNVYVNELNKYVTKSTERIQDLYLNFFEINTYNALYKYIVNNNIKMLQELYKYNNSLLFEFIDDNKSNIFHYIISQNATEILEWILNLNDDENENEIIMQLLNTNDQYKITPLLLANILQNDNICDLLNKYMDDDEKGDINDTYALPIQYKCDILSKKRRYWVIINPFAGQGKSEQIWTDFILKFLDFNNDMFEYEILITTNQFHAQNECSKISYDNYNNFDGIICVGGDGTIAEVINGLYYNENLNLKNNQNNKNICITPIATGSGNALAKELKIENILSALRKLLNGFETCIDGYIASQINEKDTYSFVSTQWGAISTIDLESESYRWMGSLRFTLKAVSEVAWSAHYKARIYFKPINDENNNNNNNNNDESDDNWWHKLPNLNLDSDDDNKVEEIPLNDNKVEEDKKEEEEESNDIIRPEYPDDWVCVEGEFGLLCVTNLQWIAEDTNMGGKGFNAKTNTLRLVWNQKTGRLNYASALLGLDKGKHLDLECVKYYDVNKVVIEPLIKGPPIDVDGERKPLKPVYVKLLPNHFVVTC